MSHLFAYGTLIFPEVMHAVCGFVPEFVAGELEGFQRYHFREELYPGLIEESGKMVAGVVYKDLSFDIWQKLDRFEGEVYERICRRVRVGEQEALEAELYVIPFARRELLSKRLWSPSEFRRTSLENFVEFCHQWMREDPR